MYPFYPCPHRQTTWQAVTHWTFLSEGEEREKRGRGKTKRSIINTHVKSECVINMISLSLPNAYQKCISVLSRYPPLPIYHHQTKTNPPHPSRVYLSIPSWWSLEEKKEKILKSEKYWTSRAFAFFSGEVDISAHRHQCHVKRYWRKFKIRKLVRHPVFKVAMLVERRKEKKKKYDSKVYILSTSTLAVSLSSGWQLEVVVEFRSLCINIGGKISRTWSQRIRKHKKIQKGIVHGARNKHNLIAHRACSTHTCPFLFDEVAPLNRTAHIIISWLFLFILWGICCMYIWTHSSSIIWAVKNEYMTAHTKCAFCSIHYGAIMPLFRPCHWSVMSWHLHDARCPSR